MDFVTPIITPIVESLLVPIKKHLGFLVSSTKHVQKMGERMEQLNDTAKDMEKKKETADVNNHVVPQHVGRWLEDVKQMNEEAEKIPTAGTGCFNVLTRYRAGKRSCDVLKTIQDLETRESKINWTNQKKPLAKVASTSTSSGPSTSAPVHNGDGTQIMFESRDLIFKAALKSLQPDNKMIALCGMGGVGKTTMMEQLKEAVENSKMFDWVLKVVLGEDPNPITIQQTIAEKLGEPLAETTLDARADRLAKMFEGTSKNGKKKILVIMDDLWKEVELTNFGLRRHLPNGFKLLFTSRFEYVCTQMGVETDSIFKVGVLKDEEAKKLFFEIVGRDGDDPELHKIGEKIVKKCGGLPIAIKTIASYLRGDIKDAWQEALSNLQHHDLQDLDGIRDRVFEMSYNHLKKEDEKAIFLLSGLFPDDFDIRIEDLMRYGWGLRLFPNVHTLAHARQRTNTCVNKLIRANLLMESDRKGCFRMHDLIRDFVLTNFTKVKQASIVNHENMRMTHNSNMSYGRILLSCKGMSQFPAEFNHPDLSLLMLLDADKGIVFPDDFCKRMSELEVVSYERMHTPLLPLRFEFSTKLRTMCLRSCTLTNDFSFLESLKNLETLSFDDCKIRNLPSAIGKLKRLKLLDVTGCAHLSIDDGVFENLVSLKELYMKVFENKAIRFTNGNCEELKILSCRLFALELEFFENKAQPKNVSFKQLERFRISIGCTLEYPKGYSFGNTLNLEAACDELRECKISELFEKTEELRLQLNDMTSIADLSLTQLPEHPFCNLRNLVVSKCSNLTYLFTIPVAHGLKKLEHLTISECPKMVSFCDTRADNEIELPKMVELILDGLPNFSSIYPDNSNASAMKSFLNKELSVPMLEKLDISKMKNLKQIWPCQINATGDKNKVSMLRVIRVKKCESLDNLFPRNPLPLLSNLQELEVGECGSIEVLFNIDMERVCEIEEESISKSSRLRRIRVNRLGKLRELWRINEGVNNNSPTVLINSFKGVEIILIENCKRFRNIFTPTTTNFDLGGVTTYMNIYDTGDELVASSHEISEESMDIPNHVDVTYTSHLMHTCHNLQYLDLKYDPRVEVVFEMDTPIPIPSSRSELATICDHTQQPPPHDDDLLLPLLLPAHHHLKSIDLRYLKEMSHVWKCSNWNKFSIPPLKLEFPFHNLTSISLYSCHKVKYLLSPLMAKFLSNLKKVIIETCEGMEEVISRRDDEIMCDASTSSHTTNTTLYFPHLDIITLWGMPCLKRIDDEIQGGDDEDVGVVMGAGASSYWSLCQYPKRIVVIDCSALSSVIPWYAAGQMKKLERLDIGKCSSITEVFESSPPPPPALTKNITTHHHHHHHHHHVPQLSNLKHVFIKGCDLLPHVFTFSTLETLNQLKTLKVYDCKALTQVVHNVKQEEEEELFNGIMTSSSSKGVGGVVVVFPRLETLVLNDLPKLEGFFLGINNNITFRFPSLEKVTISNCPEMNHVFTSAGHSETPKLNYIRTHLGKHSLDEKFGLNFHGSETSMNQQDDHQSTLFPSSDPTNSKGMPWSYHNLIKIKIEWKGDVEKIFPSNVLLQLQKLEKVDLVRCSKVKEIFEVGSPEGTNSESQIVVKIINLTNVKLRYLNSLEYIWKSNQWMKLEFPNLTTVSIVKCPKLKHVFTCSIAGSLVHLQYLSIIDCKKIEVIIKEEEEEEEGGGGGGGDANKNEIVLPCLKSIKLEKLPRLLGFCLRNEAFSLPSLDTLEINECPEIMVFTNGHLATPELKVIDTELGKFCVRNNLNFVIRTQQKEGIFGATVEIWNLSESPWLFDKENGD